VVGIREAAQKVGFRVLGEAPAVIKGPKGNQEFFLYLAKEPIKKVAGE
jgi:predicted rRNA methylase YqxC with S4 and FtsJ domains